MSEIDQILIKYNWPIKETEDNLNFRKIEDKIKFELPEDYKQFLRKYSFYETEIGEQFFKLWDFDKLLELNDGYEIIENLKMTLGIGDNGSGELIGLEKLEDGKIRIIITPFIDLDKEYHVEIGNSFTDFLKRLDSGQNWFNE